MPFWKRSTVPRLRAATLVLRQWTREHGLREHEEGFGTLAELLDACLRARVEVPERITLTATDDDGREHQVTFSFASRTGRP